MLVAGSISLIRSGEEVGMAAFVWAVVEVLCLDPPLLHQFLQTVVDLPQADTHLVCELSLGTVGVLFQPAEQVKMDLFSIYHVGIHLLGQHL